MNQIAPELETARAIVPIDLVHRALESGAGIDVLEKLMSLQERWEDNQARKAFDGAMAAAKSEIPVIMKSRQVDFTTNKGRTRYRYEDLAEIARTVDPILGQHGLSYRFRSAMSADMIAITCILSHRDGHSEENTLSAGHDASGNKNSIQAIGSTITYLQRYTLKAALGLAASDDDDAQTVGRAETSDQYAERWRVKIENAVSAAALAAEWKAEHALRGEIAWPNGAMPSRLRDDVMRAIGQLNAKQAEAEPPAEADAEAEAS
jgi:hypothetical protein